MAQPRFDIEHTAFTQCRAWRFEPLAAELFLEADRRAVTQHADTTRDHLTPGGAGLVPVDVQLNAAALKPIPTDLQRSGPERRSHNHNQIDLITGLDGPLPCKHAAHAGADYHPQPLDPQSAHEQPLHPHHVQRSEQWEALEVRLSVRGREPRPGSAIATPDDIWADDVIPFGVNGTARSYQSLPPAQRLPCKIAGHVTVKCERVDDEDRIVPRIVERAP
jgi:hypothetical protein